MGFWKKLKQGARRFGKKISHNVRQGWKKVINPGLSFLNAHGGEFSSLLRGGASLAGTIGSVMGVPQFSIPLAAGLSGLASAFDTSSKVAGQATDVAHLLEDQGIVAGGKKTVNLISGKLGKENVFREGGEEKTNYDKAFDQASHFGNKIGALASSFNQKKRKHGDGGGGGQRKASDTNGNKVQRLARTVASNPRNSKQGMVEVEGTDDRSS